MYCWPSLSDQKYLLLGDSLVKFVNRGKHLKVISVPGARAHEILMKIQSRKILIEDFSLIIVAIGTNDASDVTMPAKLAAQGIVMLMALIQSMHPTAVLMFSGLLLRPKDIGTEIEYRRKLINQIAFSMCNQRGFYCIKAWKSLTIGLAVRPRVYARDGLHLNRTGARRLYNCIEGNILNLEGKLKAYGRAIGGQ
jgi:lysophospholipase L1-like esterase